MFFMSVNVDEYSCISMRDMEFSCMLHAMTIKVFDSSNLNCRIILK